MEMGIHQYFSLLKEQKETDLDSAKETVKLL